MGSKTKVVLDTNILVSSLGWLQGNPHKILEKVIDGDIELLISNAQFEELSRVLEYPKLKFKEKQKTEFRSLISDNATFVQPTISLEVIKEDPSDNIVLECAVVAKANFIVTGDEHLLALREYKGTRIVSPSSFMANQ